MSAIATTAPPANARHQPRHWPLWYALRPMGALPTAPRAARAHVSLAVRLWQMPQIEDTAALVASELVTNAVQAATDRTGRPIYDRTGGRLPLIQLTLFTDREHLLIAVYDQAPGMPLQQHPDDTTENGRGLELIAALGQWDCQPAPGGKVVRALLATAA